MAAVYFGAMTTNVTLTGNWNTSTQFFSTPGYSGKGGNIYAIPLGRLPTNADTVSLAQSIVTYPTSTFSGTVLGGYGYGISSGTWNGTVTSIYIWGGIFNGLLNNCNINSSTIVNGSASLCTINSGTFNSYVSSCYLYGGTFNSTITGDTSIMGGFFSTSSSFMNASSLNFTNAANSLTLYNNISASSIIISRPLPFAIGIGTCTNLTISATTTFKTDLSTAITGLKSLTINNYSPTFLTSLVLGSSTQAAALTVSGPVNISKNLTVYNSTSYVTNFSNFTGTITGRLFLLNCNGYTSNIKYINGTSSGKYFPPPTTVKIKIIGTSTVIENQTLPKTYGFDQFPNTFSQTCYVSGLVDSDLFGAL